MSEPQGAHTVLVLGSPGVGKTWFINRYCDRRLEGDEPKCLDELPSKDVKVNGRRWTLRIMEVSRQLEEEVDTWIPLVEAIILMYSVSDEESFKQLDNYVNLIAQHGTPNLVTVAVGNKTDLPTECRQVRPEQLVKFGLRHNMPVFEVSSLKNRRVSDVFLGITGKLGASMAPCTQPECNDGALRLRKITCKVVVLGSSAVGKTLLLTQYARPNPRPGNPSIEPDILAKTETVGGYQVKLQLWDTVGLERFKSVMSSCLRDANAVVLMYDISNHGTFRELDFFFTLINETASQNLVVTALVGNKIDLEDLREVTRSEGRARARKHNFLFFETSCLTKQGVNEVFLEIVRRFVSSEVASQRAREDTIVLEDKPLERGAKKCRC